MTHILAIDQSTSATKAVLFDSAGGVVDRAVREHRQIYPQPGWVEHDAEEIWRNLLQVIAEVVNRQRDRMASALGLAITNQRETFVVFERRTGRPLHNAVVWQCRRGDAICNELAEHGEYVRCTTGLALDTYFSGSKITKLLGDRPELRRKVENGEALVGTIDAYLIYRLTNGEVFATDSTNASRTLLYDIGRLRWDERLCSLFDVPMHALPQVQESFATFGETNVEELLPKALPICGVMGDSQASLFAQRCYEPGMAKATFGSGTSILLNLGERYLTSLAGAVGALAWVRGGRPTYACEGLINYSSATITWLKEQLGLIADAAECEELAVDAGGNHGVYFVPAFAGLNAPYQNHTARAAILNMTAHTGKAHIVRAALESIAYQINDVLQMLRSDAGVVPSMIYADGGPTRNRFLMQFTADIANIELVVADVPESSARGAAMAGMLGLGLCRSLADCAAVPRNESRFRPHMGRAEARQLIDGWVEAIRRIS